MTFAVVDVANNFVIRTVMTEVLPFLLDEIPERGDILTVIKSGQPVEFEVRWVACSRSAMFPEGYPKVDRLIAGVFK